MPSRSKSLHSTFMLSGCFIKFRNGWGFVNIAKFCSFMSANVASLSSKQSFSELKKSKKLKTFNKNRVCSRIFIIPKLASIPVFFG